MRWLHPFACGNQEVGDQRVRGIRKRLCKKGLGGPRGPQPGGEVSMASVHKRVEEELLTDRHVAVLVAVVDVLAPDVVLGLWEG